MDYGSLKPGKNPPEEVFAVVEISMDSPPVKYEFDKSSGAMFVDRFVHTGMQYPCNYGFIPKTLSGDGDPVDVLICSSHPIISGAVVSVRPVGVLVTEDENGTDEKIMAVPAKKIDPFFSSIESYKDLPEVFIQRVNHFFENYKKLEKGKWVSISGWRDRGDALDIILDSIGRYTQNID